MAPKKPDQAQLKIKESGDGEFELSHDDELESDAEADQAEECCDPADETPETPKPKRNSKKAASQTKSTPPPTAPLAGTQTRHLYPFNVRYAADLLQLYGFVDGQAYTADEIKHVLIQNGYTEFEEMAPEFHRSEATNTLVITIKGSRKGATLIPGRLLRQIEGCFRATYLRFGTEDRLVVYRNVAGAFAVGELPMARRVGAVSCDLPLSAEVDGVTWDLAYDLHSHHLMGAFWSTTDDANERLRGVTFGVFSWKGGIDSWLFRRFTGQGFEDLSYHEVVHLG